MYDNGALFTCSQERLDCPMSSSIKLCELVDDKVWTRDVMAEVGMEIPETLAFRRTPARRLTSGKNKIKTVDFESYSSLDVNSVEKEIKTFSEKLQHSNIGNVRLLLRSSSNRTKTTLFTF